MTVYIVLTCEEGWRSLLLLVSGDIEQNPGPTPRTLSQYLNTAKQNTPETDNQEQTQSSEHRGNITDTDLVLSQSDQLLVYTSHTPVPPVRKKKKRGRPPKSSEGENNKDSWSYEDEICNLCNKNVKDGEDGMLCELSCKKWFHRECLNMSKDEYNEHNEADTTTSWECNVCSTITQSEESSNTYSVISQPSAPQHTVQFTDDTLGSNLESQHESNMQGVQHPTNVSTYNNLSNNTRSQIIQVMDITLPEYTQQQTEDDSLIQIEERSTDENVAITDPEDQEARSSPSLASQFINDVRIENNMTTDITDTSPSVEDHDTIDPRHICPQCTFEVTYDDKGLECEGCFFGSTYHVRTYRNQITLPIFKTQIGDGHAKNVKLKKQNIIMILNGEIKQDTQA